jgi:hypothetical protein
VKRNVLLLGFLIFLTALPFFSGEFYVNLASQVFIFAVFAASINLLLGYGGLATWILVQARQYTGGIHQGTESALLVRLFKGGTWVEAGVTNVGRLQAMAMFNF